MDTILQYIPIMIVGFGASLSLTPISRQIAMRLGVVDKPSQPRKTHRDHMPMMGGFAIYVAFALSLLIFSPQQHIRELLMIIAGAGMLALVGLLDDRYDISWKIRLSVQFLAALLIVIAGIQIRLFNIPYIDIPMTLIWIVALTNSTNFLDNMDGLTAGLSAIAAFFFLIIALSQGQVLVSLLAAALLGSSVGFLTYNFNPSSTFMGDMGALVLGFILAVLAIKLNFATQPLGVSWMVPVLVLALPIFDINLVVWTRIAEKRSPVEPGRDHTSHRLRDVGLSARLTLLVLYGICVICGGLAVLVATLPPDTAFFIGVAGLMMLGILYVIMIGIRRKVQLPSEKG